jgi:hypothetical protein
VRGPSGHWDGRDRQDEGGTATFGRFGADVSFVLFGDLLGDRKPETGAAAAISSARVVASVEGRKFFSARSAAIPSPWSMTATVTVSGSPPAPLTMCIASRIVVAAVCHQFGRSRSHGFGCCRSSSSRPLSGVDDVYFVPVR